MPECQSTPKGLLSCPATGSAGVIWHSLLEKTLLCNPPQSYPTADLEASTIAILKQATRDTPITAQDGATPRSLDSGPKGHGSILALLPLSCVTLNKAHNLCGPQVPHLDDNQSIKPDRAF